MDKVKYLSLLEETKKEISKLSLARAEMHGYEDIQEKINENLNLLTNLKLALIAIVNKQ